MSGKRGRGRKGELTKGNHREQHTNIASNKRPEISSEIRLSASRTTVFQGPLPPPDLLAEYDQILPGGANRLVQLLELESQHRRDKIDEEQRHVHAIEKRGQLFAFFISVGGLLVAGILGMRDGWAAATVASSVFGTGGLLYWLKTRQERADAPKKAKPEQPKEADQ